MRVTWLARQEQVAAALAACCGEDEVRLAPGESFAPWDEAYLAMDRRFGSGRALVPYLWRGDITAEEVGSLFQAAAGFYRAKPWQFLPDSQQCAVDCLQKALSICPGFEKAGSDLEAAVARLATLRQMLSDMWGRT